MRPYKKCYSGGFMTDKRNKWQIILDILEIIGEMGKVKKTRIMTRANLPWRNFKRHFDFLLLDGFIIKCIPSNDGYELTEKGKNLLQRLNNVAELVDLTH